MRIRFFSFAYLAALNITGIAADTGPWWSLQPLSRSDVPQLAAPSAAGVRNAIDAFIRSKLLEKGLSQAPEADAHTLVRRVYFDLTGLPPTPEEAAAHEQNSDPQAYEKLVDRLLASPRYGERWARHWLDVVHFGETHGYDKDQPRPNAWPYRDYVIRAFNEDKPYGRFVEEQIAGDILFPGTADGTVALGFIAAGPWDLIGHVEVPESKMDGKIARHLDRDDMVCNVMSTFSSLTIQCAQCHDHKFDPIPQKEYYALQSVFAALDRTDKRYDVDPEVAQRRTEIETSLRKIEADQQEIEKRITAAGGSELAELEAKIAAAEKAASQGRRPEYGWHSAISSEQDAKKWVQVDLGKAVEISSVALAPCWDDFNNIGPGFGFPVRYRIEASENADFSGAPVIFAGNDLVDQPNPGTAVQKFPVLGRTARYVRITATKLAPRQNDFIFSLAEVQIFDPSGKNIALKAQVTSLDSVEAPVRWCRSNLTDDIYPAATGGGELKPLRQQRTELLAKVVTPELRQRSEVANKSHNELRIRLSQLPAQQVVYAGAIHHGSGSFTGTGPNQGKPRPIFVLSRGDISKPKDEAKPGALSCLTSLPAEFNLPPDAPEGRRRAVLAHWLTRPENPLTWRSIVNRLWFYHFGRGLVDTPSDFGRMGQLPTHPELLDWLALELRDGGQSLKKLHRLILTSATYRQKVQHNLAAEKLDAENRLLWRMNRRKLEAEAVRDSVLAVAGKLDLAMGGPSFQDFIVTHPEHSPHYEYQLADPENPKLHRRSIYRFLVRSQQQPYMASLDCADPSMLVDRRNQTITPLQALAQLNNQLVLAMASHFAARVQREAGHDVSAQIERAFLLAFARRPTPAEARELSPYTAAQGLTNTCRLLLNLNEFAFVD